MKYVFYLLATMATFGLATLTASAASASFPSSSSLADLNDLTSELTLETLDDNLASDGLVDLAGERSLGGHGKDLTAGQLDGLTGNSYLDGLDGKLTSGNPFSWLKSGVKKLVRTFAPRIVSRGYSWLESRLSSTARKLAGSPNSAVSQHINKAWSSGTGCPGFRAGTCNMCKAVAEDAVGGTSLDQMLHNHQASARRPRCISPF